MAAFTRQFARGALAGLVAGAIWWIIEMTANWAYGGTIDVRSGTLILGLDLGFGAVGGILIGVVATSATGLAFGLVALFGFIRLFEPPGMRSEIGYATLALGCAVVGTRLVRREGPLAFVHLTLVAVAATVFGKAGFTEAQSYFGQVEPNAATLVLVLLGLPVGAVAADRLVGLAIPRAGRRLAAELACGGLALLFWGHPLPTAPLDAPPPRPLPVIPPAPDVILVSLDTTRADHLSTYGYARETSPNLTALARDALNFTEARSPAEWTVPGHASMLTGMFPSRHGAHYAGAWQEGPQIYGRRRVFPLADDRVTLAEVLRERGYRTGAFLANFANLYRGFGMAQGFDHYDDAPGVMLKPFPHVVRFVQRFRPAFFRRSFRSAHEIFDTALAWMDAGPRDRPVFLFLNVLEPHQCVLPPPPFDRWAWEVPGARRLAHQSFFTHAIPTHLSDGEQAFIAALYDGQIALMDDALGELLAGLRARGRYEDALLIVTADHGELLGEHDEIGHGGRMMYEGLLHIPLVVKLPGADRTRGGVHEPVELVDILPTVLAAVGAPVPPGVQGSVLPHVRHEIVAEEHINPEFVRHFGSVYDRAIRVIYDGPWKLIQTSTGERMLFDLAHDPREEENLASREPARLGALQQRLDAAMSVMVTQASGASRVD